MAMKDSDKPAPFPPNVSTGTVKIDEAQGQISLRTAPVLSPIGNRIGTSVVRIDGSKIELAIDKTGSAESTVFRADSKGTVSVGGDGKHGVLLTRDEEDNETIKLYGQSGHAEIGGHGALGKLAIKNRNGLDIIKLDAASGEVNAGGHGVHGKIAVKDKDNNTTLVVDGATGDIVLQNADCAEDFDVAAAELAEPGTVMVLDADGRLRPCSLSYDRKAVGVISGAGDYRPGIVLDRKPSASPRAPIAMFGKVFCKVDAAHGCIEVGDLLTTSPTAGHAMKAADPTRAFGAMIGKALRTHTSGRGLIPILVVMQ